MEDEIVFNKISDQTTLVGVINTDDGKEDVVQVSGYGLEVKVNSSMITDPRELDEAFISLAMALRDKYLQQIMDKV